MKNEFLKNVQKGDARTWNDALSNSSTGSTLADQFGKAGTYRGRDYQDVVADCAALWEFDPTTCVRFMFYLRLITRKPKGFDEVARGQGQRDEFLKRLLWLGINHPEVFKAYLYLVPVVGRYKDLFELLSLDNRLTKELDWDFVFNFILDALNGEDRDLVIKYLPYPKKGKTDYAKNMDAVARAFMKYAEVDSIGSLKKLGKAHTWQKNISRQEFSKINFSLIPGKALLNLVSGKFLENQKLVPVYMKWLESQGKVKFNGFPYELVLKAYRKTLPKHKSWTIDKQFENLLDTAGEGAITGNVWCALDTSGSMQAEVSKGIRAIDVCLGLGLYFANLNKGAFHKNIIMFDNVSKVKQLSGSFTDQLAQLSNAAIAWGSTNFQGVIDRIINVRQRNPNIPLEDFPQTLLVVSDMQFNPTGNETTNYQEAVSKLASVFPREWAEKFRIIWWQVSPKPADFPSTIDDPGTYVFSGFDGAVISFLLGKEVKHSMTTVIEDVLNQEVLQLIEV